ncbi:MAG: hypothetical protein LQ349_006259 [Xanthoria aureola]|nr:MAG: hypothetical protein LQ349_006259 [Xanthoria aureola]
MSSPSQSSLPASDLAIENALRDAVERKFHTNPEHLTVKRIRTDVEHQLGLGDGFFKADVTWNPRSKEIIQLQVDAQEAQSRLPSSQPANPSPAKQQGHAETNGDALSGRKRQPGASGGPTKRQKKRDPSLDNPSGEDGKPSTKSAGHLRRSKSSSLLSSTDEEKRKPIADADPVERSTNVAEDQGSESEMSVLLDEDPKPKKRARKVGSEKPKPRKEAKREGSKPVKTQQQTLDPDAEEIKRLQGWLVKCGIRKMWFKELAPYDTPRAKIRHLKDMLTEAGMVGRFSQEKATQIREARELRADLDAVQAGNKQWGKAESDDGTENRPRRRLARGLQELDFLRDDDSDGD